MSTRATTTPSPIPKETKTDSPGLNPTSSSGSAVLEQPSSTSTMVPQGGSQTTKGANVEDNSKATSASPSDSSSTIPEDTEDSTSFKISESHASMILDDLYLLQKTIFEMPDPSTDWSDAKSEEDITFVQWRIVKVDFHAEDAYSVQFLDEYGDSFELSRREVVRMMMDSVEVDIESDEESDAGSDADV
ncbi:hypothetical protein GYMLUDRAFT_262632 [Collybiopsis luxurians FD-317 M1]|uniref:Unplaced genomic scaffold GYMLUscaffold_38, whole genome shotgun sequence n=1 Tax=Collybiopsis luxurians FD-317 M1 TaxID=944289 RepID=A0A0D0CRS0_9AGAR|nr:hypothetical protein GYMLUDRAFT_262632 [Collybiopsis luxurians FD-317 M1]